MKNYWENVKSLGVYLCILAVVGLFVPTGMESMTPVRAVVIYVVSVIAGIAGIRMALRGRRELLKLDAENPRSQSAEDSVIEGIKNGEPKFN